jgi:DNA-binding beta-propeller fold protein YncE
MLRTRSALWAVAGLVALGVMALPGCGGGGGGGGGGNLPDFLALGTTIFYGTTQAGVTNLTPFQSLPAQGVPVPPGGAQNVPAIVIPGGVAGRQDFIQLSFNTLIDATTIQSNPPSGADGIVLLRVQEVPAGSGNVVSTAVPFLLDSGGLVDPSNAFPSPGVAPTTLRLYADGDGSLVTPESFINGNYTLVITQSLRAFGGGPFCTVGGGANCVNTYLPAIPFAVGNDTLPFRLATTTPSTPLQNDPSAQLNSEVVLNFNKAVNFVQLVGGPNNVTTRDPFISRPRSLARVADCNPCNNPVPPPIAVYQNIGNLYVSYLPPGNPAAGGALEVLPGTLGYIVYMPDPFLNPTQVRIRFCDISTLQPVDNPGAFNPVYQNYASNPSKLPIPSSNPALGGALLQLPAAVPVPGSLPGYNPALYTADIQSAIFDVVVMSGNFNPAAFPFPQVPPNCQTAMGPFPAAPCYMSFNGGATDRSGNALVSDFALRFVFAPGQPLARNPQPPDAVFVGRQGGAQRGVACINTATTTVSAIPGGNFQLPPWAGGQIQGVISMRPNPLANPSILGAPKDLEVGHFIRSLTVPGQGTNVVSVIGRGTVAVAGVPDAQNGGFPTSVGNLVCPMQPVPVQPLGNFLYVVDSEANAVKVFNGYNFQLITTLVGIPSPEGLGISPDLTFLYVSNFNQGTIQQIFANPGVPQFHTIARTITVGAGPSAISVCPNNEDVFVCNFAGNSFSIVDTATFLTRITLNDAAALGPSDCFITNRMLGMGLTNAYTAFIPNRFSNNVTIYESDSPAVPENSLQGVVKGNQAGFAGPRRGTWNWQTYIGGTTEPGAFIANTTSNRVDELTMQNFTLSPPPNFPGPPGTRTYRILKSLNATGLGAVGNASPSDATIDNFSGIYNFCAFGNNNNKALADPAQGGGIPSVVLVSYPAAGLVVTFTYGSGGIVLSSASVPGCDFLQSYYDQ